MRIKLNMEIEFTDRYSALGIPRPNPATVCREGCEGTGFIPIKIRPATMPIFIKLWHEQHERECNVSGVLRLLWKHKELWLWRSVGRDILRYLRGGQYCDGYHFVTCPTCKGTGKR